MSDKIRVNMLSMADTVKGQGVGSAYSELINLLENKANDELEISINKGTKFDVLHAHTVEPKNFLKMKITKGKTVAYVHFLPYNMPGAIHLPKPIFSIFKKYVMTFYKTADKLVIVNPQKIKYLLEQGVPKDKIVYIPNFVSKSEFYALDGAEKQNLRNKYGFNQNDFIVLGVGQVQTVKGVKEFVQVAEQMPNIQFVWAGGFSFGKITDGYKELKKIMENPPKNVKFLGIVEREKMNEVYNLANVLFVPSYNELFPMVSLEATSVELPLVLRDLDLYHGILFDKYLRGNNNKEFISLIEQLRKNQELYQEAKNNSIYISNYYNEDRIVELWKKFYRDLIEE